MKRARRSGNWLRRIAIASILALTLLGLGTLRSRVIWVGDSWRAECSYGAATIFWKRPSAKGTFQSQPFYYSSSLDRMPGPIEWLPSFALRTPVRFVTIPLWLIVVPALLVIVHRRRQRMRKAPIRRRRRHYVAITSVSLALVILLSVSIASAWWSIGRSNRQFSIWHGRIQLSWGPQWNTNPNWILYRNRRTYFEWRLSAALSSGGASGVVILPLWIPLALLMVPLGRVCLLTREHRPPNHCRRCNYNLTGLPEPRCPECGQPFEPKGDAP